MLGSFLRSNWGQIGVVRTLVAQGHESGAFLARTWPIGAFLQQFGANVFLPLPIEKVRKPPFGGFKLII